MGKSHNLLSIKFDREPVYGDNNKYTKTKTKLYGGKINKIFKAKKYQKKMHHISAYH